MHKVLAALFAILLYVQSAFAFPHLPLGVIASGLSEAAAPSGDGMQAFVAETDFDLDATLSASYGGSGQTWSNIITVPESGAGQTDWDFYRGTDGSSSTDDPTFVGSAGDSGAYFSYDGGDFNNLVAGSNPSWINGATKASGTGWLACAFKTPSSLSTTKLMATSSGNGQQGFWFAFLSGGQASMYVFNNSGLAWAHSWAGQISGNTDYVFITTWDLSLTTETSVHYVNGVSNTSDQSGITYGTNDNTGTMNIASENDDSNPAGTGLIIRGCSGGNKKLTPTEAADIYNEYNTRHGGIY